MLEEANDFNLQKLIQIIQQRCRVIDKDPAVNQFPARYVALDQGAW